MNTATSSPPDDGRFDVLSEQCPTRQVVGRIGDKWTLLVITALTDETVRFSELRRRVAGITQKMLTQTLRGLERDGLVKRTVYPVIPPRVEYQLTTTGQTLTEVVSSIRIWAYASMDAIAQARVEYDERAHGASQAP
jgi:DNA-binding HxlR family transcriptional regulator